MSIGPTSTFHIHLRAALRERLLAMTGLPDVAWEGKAYAPVVGKPYISESMRAVSSLVAAPGRGGYRAHTVTFNLMLHYPANKGTVPIETMAGLLLQHFSPGSTVSYQSVSVVIQNSEKRALLQEPDWIACPVIITMTGHTAD